MNINNLDIDLYQARMLIGYYLNGMKDVQGVMEAYCRKLPPHRRYLVACGVERVLEFLKEFRFTEDEVVVLEGMFQEIDFNSTGLRQYLLSLNPAECLQINAMMDGQLLFANEPVIQVIGPVGVAQYIEKKILSILNHDIRIASKAARVAMAAGNRPVFEFGGRRANDCCSASAARAAYIAGCASSSSVAGFVKYGVPCSGTMGHVWVMSHTTEAGNPFEHAAFKAWGKTFKNSTYLVDTYDSIEGTRNALNAAKNNIGAIRLDSGDIAKLSIDCRRMINESGNPNVKIVASDDLNEYKIRDMISSGAQIDAFGVGTEIVSTPDAVTCGFIYKLVAIQSKSNGKWHNVMKWSSSKGKKTYPGRKQVYRFFRTLQLLSWLYRSYRRVFRTS